MDVVPPTPPRQSLVSSKDPSFRVGAKQVPCTQGSSCAHTCEYTIALFMAPSSLKMEDARDLHQLVFCFSLCCVWCLPAISSFNKTCQISPDVYSHHETAYLCWLQMMITSNKCRPETRFAAYQRYTKKSFNLLSIFLLDVTSSIVCCQTNGYSIFCIFFVVLESVHYRGKHLFFHVFLASL